MNESKWEKKLKIHTTGRDDSKEDEYHYPYEPTPYCVLERLAESGYLEKESVVVDYGCGKGRVGFFLHHQLGCGVIGIDFDNQRYENAVENLKSYGHKEDISFYCISAEEYQLRDADCFFFFNPFSVEILKSVMGRILESYYENPRLMRLFFYYPNDEYVAYLMTTYELSFLDEIDCSDLFEGNNRRERILIFSLP